MPWPDKQHKVAGILVGSSLKEQRRITLQSSGVNINKLNPSILAMKVTSITALTAGLVVSTGVNAAPTLSSEHTSPNPLAARGLWFRDECHASMGGTVVGGSTLWMLRNTWNNRFGGDFGGNLDVYGIKGVCCWGQCLWVLSEGQGRSWSGDAWGNALHRLTGVTGDSQPGLCGARINGDAYLILMSAQHDKVSHQGRIMSDHFGDTCGGRPPW